MKKISKKIAVTLLFSSFSIFVFAQDDMLSMLDSVG